MLFAGLLFSQGIEFNVTENNKMGRIQCTRFLDNHTIAYTRDNCRGFQVISLSKLKMLKPMNGLRGQPDALEFSLDKKYLVGTMRDGEIGVWAVKSRKLKYQFGTYDPGYYVPRSISFAPDGKRFHVFEACTFPIRELKSGEVLDTINPLENDCMYAGCFTSDMKKFYAGGNDNIWVDQPEKGYTFQEIPTDDLSIVTDLALSPNEEILAVAGRKGLWLLDTDLLEENGFEGHEDWVNEIAFSPDGHYLYSSSGTIFGDDYTVRVWNTKTGECEKIFNEHSDAVKSIDISPDGKWLVSGSRDKTINIYNTQNLSLIHI